MLLSRRELVAGAAALLVLLGATGRLALEPILTMRSELQETNEHLARTNELLGSQVALTRDLLEGIDAQLALTREMRDSLQRSVEIQREGLDLAMDVAADTEHLLAHVHDLRDDADALLDLVRVLIALTRDLNSKFPDNPSGQLPPP